MLWKITISSKYATSVPRPRDGGVSNSPPTSHETPPKLSWIRAGRTLIAPLPFFAGPSTSHIPPNNYTLFRPDFPPLERQGGRVGKTINFNDHTAWLLLILRCYAPSIPCAPGDRLWRARQLFFPFCLGYSIFIVSRRPTKSRLLKIRIPSTPLQTPLYYYF